MLRERDQPNVVFDFFDAERWAGEGVDTLIFLLGEQMRPRASWGAFVVKLLSELIEPSLLLEVGLGGPRRFFLEREVHVRVCDSQSVLQRDDRKKATFNLRVDVAE